MRRATRPRAAEPRRRAFVLDPSHVNLTTFLLAPHPRVVREAIERHRRALDAKPALYLREPEAELEDAARAAAAGYLGTEPDQVALTDSTTMGLGLVYARLRLRPRRRGRDDRARLLRDARGAAPPRAARRRRTSAGSGSTTSRSPPRRDAIVPGGRRALAPRTRCLALTWVHSSSGVKLPLREIADAVADANRGRRESERILLCVDGVHGFGVEDASPVELGVDFFVSGCHKWLFGPRGTGLIWAAPHAWARLAPTIPTFDGRAYVAWIEGRAPADTPPGPLMTPGGFHSFEHRWALPEAFEFHAHWAGARRSRRRRTRSQRRLKEGLGEIPGVTPEDPARRAALGGPGLPPTRGPGPGREWSTCSASGTGWWRASRRTGPRYSGSVPASEHGPMSTRPPGGRRRRQALTLSSIRSQ